MEHISEQRNKRKTVTRMVIARAPIKDEDIRESEAEVRFLIAEERLRLLTSSFSLLISIDSVSSWFACLQTQVHNVPVMIISNVSSSDKDIVVSCFKLVIFV